MQTNNISTSELRFLFEEGQLISQKISRLNNRLNGLSTYTAQIESYQQRLNHHRLTVYIQATSRCRFSENL